MDETFGSSNSAVPGGPEAVPHTVGPGGGGNPNAPAGGPDDCTELIAPSDSDERQSDPTENIGELLDRLTADREVQQQVEDESQREMNSLLFDLRFAMLQRERERQRALGEFAEQLLSDKASDRPAASAAGEQAETAIRITNLLGDGMRAVLQIAHDRGRKANTRMRDILALDRTWAGRDSAEWAELLGVSPSAIRQTRCWKELSGEGKI